MSTKSIKRRSFWLFVLSFLFLQFLVHLLIISWYIWVGYHSVEKQTKGSEKVFYDFKKVCNRGEVRYQLDSAHQNIPGFTVTDDFAAAVCGLSEEYEQSKYLYFIERWGTVSMLPLNLT